MKDIKVNIRRKTEFKMKLKPLRNIDFFLLQVHDKINKNENRKLIQCIKNTIKYINTNITLMPLPHNIYSEIKNIHHRRDVVNSQQQII